MDSPRATCIVPERPLLISEEEEWRLNKIACSLWQGVETLVEWANEGVSPMLAQTYKFGAQFPQGLTMPPALRVDVVRTCDGPKVVEIDTISALSLGETLFLSKVWSDEGFRVLEGLKESIVASSGGALRMELPKQKSEYEGELNYLQQELEQAGVVAVAESDPDVARLSAFSEVAAMRRLINSGKNFDRVNPLWGVLYGLTGKDNLQMIQSVNKQDTAGYIPKLYTEAAVSKIDKPLIVAKPKNGTGSNGVQAIEPSGALLLSGENWTFQELLTPLSDEYGIKGDWKSRVSLYVGRKGLLGAQVTARRSEGVFTNVHGQSDAIQTTLAIE